VKEHQHPCYYMCRVCSNALLVTEAIETQIICDRCGELQHWHEPKSAMATLAYSLTALIFFIPSNLYPFMTVELYGNRNSSTVWGGILSLVEDGSWPIALIVFLASLVIPALKLIILFYLGLTANNQSHPKFKTRLYHIIESIGRWSMLDIFLLAVLVAIVKLGRWTTVEPEPGSYMFAMVVIFTMLASASFDPQLLWKENNGKIHSTKN